MKLIYSFRDERKFVNQQKRRFSKTGHILTAVGAAVGVANLVLFPARVYNYGGLAFILAFLLCTFILGVPLMIAETALGRRQQTDAVRAYQSIGGRPWRLAGFLGLIVNLFVLSFYIIVSGWALFYFYNYLFNYSEITSAVEHATSTGKPSIAGIGHFFGSFVTNTNKVILFSGIYMLFSCIIVGLNIRTGIERVSKTFVPFLVMLMIGLIILLPFITNQQLNYQNFQFDLSALFQLDESGRIGIIEAVGQAFFSLALGACAMITYGSHAKKEVNIVSNAHFIVHIDTLVALLAALLILPLIVQSDKLGADPTLVFITLVDTFQGFASPWDRIIGILFFLLFNFAIITSTIAMMEPTISYLSHNKQHKRKLYSLCIGLLTFLMSIPAILSFNSKSPGFLKDFLNYGNPGDNTMGYFNFLIDFFGTFCLLIGTLLLCLFIRSKWTIKGLLEELSINGYQPSNLMKRFLTISIYWITPILMLCLLFGELLKLKFRFGF